MSAAEVLSDSSQILRCDECGRECVRSTMVRRDGVAANPANAVGYVCTSCNEELDRRARRRRPSRRKVTAGRR